MIRLFSILIILTIVAMLVYLLIKAHGALLIKWKRFIEEYEDTEGQMFEDETKLKDFVDLIGWTLVPALADLFVIGMTYFTIKGLVS